MKAIYPRYHKAGKKAKKAILDEFCKTYKCHRKHAIRLLGNWTEAEARPKRRSAPRRYGGQRFGLILEAVWEGSGHLWSTRLKAAMSVWMPHIRRRFKTSGDEERLLLSISPAQIDRLLKPQKLKLGRRIYGTTKPGRMLKHQIPIKTDHWDVDRPGFTEIDLVSHSGSCGEGAFAHTLNVTDIHTGWVERRCVLGKGQEGIRSALDEIRRELPFPLLGIDSDNGSEFINAHLWRYCRQEPAIQFTRGRPYKKDDNAHIEQKNWTHVRQLLGYERFDKRAAIAAINDLYRNELRWFQNIFQPSVKLIRKTRIGSRLKREYDKPLTPLERVGRSKYRDKLKTAQLERLCVKLDPFDLSSLIDRKLARIQRRASKAPRPSRHKAGHLPTYWDKRLAGEQIGPASKPVFKDYERLLEKEHRLQTI